MSSATITNISETASLLLRVESPLGTATDYTKTAKSRSGREVLISASKILNHIHVATFADGKEVGCADVHIGNLTKNGNRLYDKEYGELWIEVEEDYKKEGIAGLLMDTVFEIAKEHKLKAIVSYVYATNTPALALHLSKRFSAKPRPNGCEMPERFHFYVREL